MIGMPILHTELKHCSSRQREDCAKGSWAKAFSNVSFGFSSFWACNFYSQTIHNACGLWRNATLKTIGLKFTQNAWWSCAHCSKPKGMKFLVVTFVKTKQQKTFVHSCMTRKCITKVWNRKWLNARKLQDKRLPSLMTSTWHSVTRHQVWHIWTNWWHNATTIKTVSWRAMPKKCLLMGVQNDKRDVKGALKWRSVCKNWAFCLIHSSSCQLQLCTKTSWRLFHGLVIGGTWWGWRNFVNLLLCACCSLRHNWNFGQNLNVFELDCILIIQIHSQSG